MIFIGVVIFGIYSYLQLPVDFFPKIDPPIISVFTYYNGANASDVEQNITRKLEDGFGSLTGLKKIRADILINTTPVGMHPQTKNLPLPQGLLRQDMLVMDIIYNPIQTALLKHSRQIGCRIIDGVAMFVYQGAFQFGLWTGEEAPVETMRAAVYAALNETHD